MKKLTGIIICLIIVFCLGSCAGGENNNTGSVTGRQTGVSDVIKEKISEADSSETYVSDDLNSTSETDVSLTAATITKIKPEKGIDIDLTVLSGTMVYSEVYSMLSQPEQYVGKTVKMKGTSFTIHPEGADETYYACIIKDATACCSQGIEYELSDGYSYPETDEEITVVGKFETYTKDGYVYCTLRNSKLV